MKIILVLIVFNMNIFMDIKDNIDYGKIDRFLSEARSDKEKIEYLSDYIAQYPQDDYLNGMYAYFLIGYNIEEARKFISKKELEINVKGGFVTFASAAIANELGNLSRAELLYDRCLSEKITINSKWLYLELFYFESNEEKADYYLKKCLELDSNFYYGLISLAYYYYRPDSQCKEVVDIYKKLNINFDLETYEVINFFAFALYSCGEYDKSRELFHKSLQKEINAEAYGWLGSMYSTYYHDWDKAEECFLKAIEISSDNDVLESKRALAWLYYVKGDFVRAEVILSEIVEQDFSQAYFDDLTTFYLKLNQLDKAEDINETSIKVNGLNEMNSGYKQVIKYLRNNQHQLEELNNFLNKYNTDVISYFNYLMNLL